MRIPGYAPLIIAGIFFAFFAVEKLFPLRSRKRALVARLFLNFMMSGLVFLTAMTVVRPLTLRTLRWGSQKAFGFLHFLPESERVQMIAGFLLLDLSFYYWHRVNHKIPLLWRFHNVHHIDPDLDVSTGFRFHFVEVLFSTLFRISQVGLIGVSFTTFSLYELVFQANTLFHHSNFRLPIRLERVLNQVLVTPRMHGIHHSQVRAETDSNYGVVFCWWDKLHRTLGLNIPQSKIEIGIPGYSLPEDNHPWQALTLPFRRQRDYWRKPDGTSPERNTAALTQDRAHLAE
jgi:sterol desaturase/sphingolipid hydroxylase (fatty acid hydroxylase superfamily)